jgi:murein DD-endopeptidase MepM/ murein hydrolase activator NlpD
MVDISYRYSLSGGDQAKAELKSIGDAAEAAETRAIRAAEARARKVEAVERELAKVRTDAEKASAKASAALGGPDNFAVYQRRAAEEQRMLVLKREQEKEDAKLAARAAALVASVDPLSQAKARYNAETEEAILLASRELITIEQRDAALRQSKATLDAATLAQNRNGASLGQQRAGYQQLGFQIQDITQQIALGTPPLVIMAQQAGQTASAIDLTTGASAGAAAGGLRGALMRTVAFMSGPWGAGVTGAALILGMLISKSGEAGDAADKLKEKQKSLTERIKEQNDSLRENIRLQDEKLRGDVSSSQRLVSEASSDLKRKQAQLTRAENELINLRATPVTSEEDGATRSGFIRDRLAEIQQLREEIANLEFDFQKATSSVRSANVALARRESDARNDKALAETIRNEKALAALFEQYTAIGSKMPDGAFRKALDAEIDLHRRNTKEIEANTKALKANVDARVTQFVNPVDNSFISSGFGPRKRPKAGASAFHPAVDFLVAVGTDVKATADGVIEFVDFAGKSGLGRYVVINHGAGTKSRYAHLSSILMQPGQEVGQGQVFAKSGNTGVSTGPHLDFQITRNGKPVDPKAMLFPTDQYAVDRVALKELTQTAEDMFQARKALISQTDPLRALWMDDADRQAEIARLAAIDPARGGLTAAEARRYSIGSTVAAIGRENEITGAEREDASAQDKFREYEEDQRRQREIVKATLEDDDQRTQYLERQLELVGATDDVRRREMVRLDAILELQRQGIDAESARGQEVINSALAVDDLERAYERANALQEEFRQFGERTIDTVFDPRNFDDWGNAGKRVLNDLKNLFIELALLNPLKNALLGQDNPTLGGAGGFLGGLFGGGGGNGIAPGDGALGIDKLFPFGLGRNAMGTEYFGGGLTLLGENGPEIASLPRGSRVTPSAETRRMLGGSAPSPVIINQTLNVPVGLDLATKAEVGKMGEAVYAAARTAIVEERRRSG